MLRISKNEYELENCSKYEFNNALDDFITRLWRKSRSMNLKDVTNYVYDNINKFCVNDVENTTYFKLKSLTRTLVSDLDLDRSQSTESMVLDEIFNVSCFYSRCNTENEDF